MICLENFEAINSQIAEPEKNVIRVIKSKEIIPFDEATYARLKDSHFHNGTIEVKVLSRLLPDAPDFARGFLGITFRIDEENENFEGIYIRPANGRCEDQVRRNHSTQYFSYPEYKFDRLREIAPEKYESYADMTLDEWIDFTLDVWDNTAKLYLHKGPQPVLVVNDLKQGPDKAGAIGLWVEVGTEGYFKDLKITHRD